MAKGLTSESNGLGDFAPSGEPKKLNSEGGEKPSTEKSIDAALAEFAPIGKATKYSSLNADGEKVDIPTTTEKSIYNK